MQDSKLAYFIAGGVVALVAAGATHFFESKPKTTAGSHVLLSPEDYIEIQQLYGMYARDVDPGAVREASWMFADDATALIVTGSKPMTTPEDFKSFYAGMRKGQGSNGGVRHFNTSQVIVGTPDGGARGSGYMMQVETLAEGGTPQVTLFGKYEDKFVKTPKGWRIKERVWQRDTFRGSTLPVPPSPVPGDRSTDDTGLKEISSRSR